MWKRALVEQYCLFCATNCPDTQHSIFKSKAMEGSICADTLQNGPLNSVEINQKYIDRKKANNALRRKKRKRRLSGIRNGITLGETASDGTLPQGCTVPTLSQPKKIKAFENPRVAPGIQMSVIPDGFPYTLITKEQAELVQNSILEEIDGIPEGGPSPKFLSSVFRGDVLKITCSNQLTSTWLEKIIEGCKPWEGAVLKAMESKDLPKFLKVGVWIPGTRNDEPKRLLHRIGVQNETLKTEGWRVLDQKGNTKGQRLTILIGENSVRALETLKFTAFLNFSRIAFKVLGRMREEEETDLGVEETVVSDSQADSKDGLEITLPINTELSISA